MSPNILLVKSLKKFKFFLLFIFLCILFFSILFFVNQFFLIKKIQIVSDREFLFANRDELINKNLIFVNQNEIANKIVKENSFLRKVIVNKIWPVTLKLTVYFHEPIALLIVNQGFLNLSIDGRILSKTKEVYTDLPIINYYQKLSSNSFQIGDRIDYKDIQQTLFFIDKLEQINLKPLTIDIKGQDMLLFKLSSEKIIVFSSQKERQFQIYQLEIIVKQFKIKGKEFKKIDLRFDKPIIQF